MTLLQDDVDDLLQQRAIKLIQPLIPPDAQDRVERAVTQYNIVVRERIREETRFSLSSETDKGSISVRVVDGFPASVASLIDKFHEVMLWRLITLQPKLGGVIEGLGTLLLHWDDFEAWSESKHFSAGAGPALERSRDVAHGLQTLAATRRVFDEVKQIHDDILGAYWHADRKVSRVDIYWMAQALFAAAFGIRIEDLTIVTLAHELAHGYTHIGRDAAGDFWDQGFGATDKNVTEGLAQHYTATVTEKLSGRAPNAYAAYLKLLEHQSGPYLAHESWFQGHVPRRAEIVRHAMLRARSKGVVKDADWRTLLAAAKKDLTGT
jgi:hypothetical protein